MAVFSWFRRPGHPGLLFDLLFMVKKSAPACS
jgi:hypothetical protein